MNVNGDMFVFLKLDCLLLVQIKFCAQQKKKDQA